MHKEDTAQGSSEPCVGIEETEFEYTWPRISERGEREIPSSALALFVQTL